MPYVSDIVIGNDTYCSDGTFRGLFYWIMRRGREAAITIQCRLLCYGKTCSWTHVVWKSRLFLQFNVTYVHILSGARRGCQQARCARAPRMDTAHTPRVVNADNAKHPRILHHYCFDFSPPLNSVCIFTAGLNTEMTSIMFISFTFSLYLVSPLQYSLSFASLLIKWARYNSISDTKFHQ